MISLLLFAAVAYYRFEPVREVVNAKCPWVKDQLGQHGIQLEETTVTPPAATPAGEATKTGKPLTVGQPAAANLRATTPAHPRATARANVAARNGTSLRLEPYPEVAKPGATATAAQGNSVGIVQIASDHSLWPKNVKIKKATLFPAVSQGKEVGKWNLPAGTEVKLVSINADKVAITFSSDGTMSNTGGTWVQAADTDLLERVAHARR